MGLGTRGAGEAVELVMLFRIIPLQPPSEEMVGVGLGGLTTF